LLSGYAPPENIRDVTFGEDAATSRTGRGPVNLATIRAAVIAALKDAGYLHIPEGRRDHTTPASTASIRTETDIHGTRRSPADLPARSPRTWQLPGKQGLQVTPAQKQQPARITGPCWLIRSGGEGEVESGEVA
jgi:hypothetical protein